MNLRGLIGADCSSAVSDHASMLLATQTGENVMLKYTLVSQASVPIWVVEGTSRPSNQDGPVNDLFSKLVKDERDFPEYRGVAISRFTNVLLTGVDVKPTDAPIFVSDFDKAWEYPSMYEPRVVFALRQSMLIKSFKTLPLDAAADEIAEVRKDYPYQHQNEHSLWFTRIAEQNRNLAYEAAYGHWVPGNAKNALVAMFLFGITAEVFTTAMQALGKTLESM